MFPKRFQRKIEDFACENCEREVKGNGYTNHCPDCLWSKHVDENPGDRKSECGGLMKPESILFERKTVILHRCTKCDLEKRNKVSDDDKIVSDYPWQ